MIPREYYKDNKVIPMDVNDEHYIAELICVHCYHRGIHLWNTKTLMKELECQECHMIGTLIQTGEILPNGESSLEIT